MTIVMVKLDEGRWRRTIALPAELVRYRDGGRTKLTEEGRCRMCLRPRDVRKLTRHHLVGQEWFRLYGLPTLLRDAEANIIPLCWVCHILVEDPFDSTGRMMLRKVLAPQEAALAIKLRGLEWFEHRHPATRA